MIRGERVEVLTRKKVGTDKLNNAIYEWVSEPVENVLVAPGSAQGVSEDNRPDGTTVTYTLYFPKAFTGRLENERVTVRGNMCEVIGHPDLIAQSPTPWNMVVEVEAVHG